MQAPWRPTRRELLGTMGLAVLGVACSSSGGTDVTPTGPAPTTSGPSGAPGSIAELSKGATQMSVLSNNTPVPTGTVRFSFALSDAKGLITGGSPRVYAAKDQTSKAIGPAAATWYPFTAYDLTHDASPKSPLLGTYEADITLPASGNWIVGVLAAGSSQTAFGSAALPVAPSVPGAVPHAPGSKATSVATPVATTDAAIAAICTRTPVCHLHAVSLDAALKNGKPTVVSFATPLLCETMLCGPVVDEQILAGEHVGANANVIHVEEFLPGPSHTPPAATLENQSPGFKAWKLDTEPWVFVIDKHGVIRESFEGPVTAPQIEAALQPLL